MNHRSILPTLALAFAALSPDAAHAAEGSGNCIGFIDALPATISAPGTWCLRKNLSTAIASGSAITVNADHVTIDCNDFKIGGSAAGMDTNAAGIQAPDQTGITVRNCNLRGFSAGISLGGWSGGHVVEDNRLDGNTSTGISVGGENSTVRRNQVYDTGGSTQNSYVYGIITFGATDIEDNTIAGVTAAVGSNGRAHGIYTGENPDGNISRNRIRALAKDGGGSIRGIYASGGGRVVLRGNDVVGDQSELSVGLHCSTDTHRAIDNVVNGFANPIRVCADAGGNDTTP